MNFGSKLSEGIAALDLQMELTAQGKLIDYIRLLDKWNQTYNLTAIRDPREMISKHILDSLAITPYIERQEVMDVGTGAGLPGIPLALYYPGKNFTLVDSSGKKCRFLTQVKQNLELNNVTVVNARVQEYQSSHCFSTIVSRAFSSLAEMIQNTQHLCCNDGQFLAMKGAYPGGELEALEAKYRVTVIPLHVPSLDAERHVVSIRNIL